jgi:hypothetical protein
MVRKNKKVQKSVLVQEEVLASSSSRDDDEDIVSKTEEQNTKCPATSVQTSESKGVALETSIPSTTNVPAIPVLVHPVNLAVTGNVGISSSVASLPSTGNIATTKPRVTMTKKEIKIWKASYTENDLTSFFECMTEDYNQKPFWKTLAQVMIKSSSE